jgi:RimJ/RimL family protein N-acetyltransferase
LERAFTTKDGRAGLVREARPRDARACLDIVREAANERPRTILTSDEIWSPRQWRRNRLGLGDRGVTLVAEMDGVVAGTLGVNRGDRPALRHTAEFGITVATRFRGVGFGRALLEALEDWARGVGVEKVVLGVHDHNTVARSLYESMGYEVEGVNRREAKFAEGYIDIVRMAKFLG